MSTIFDNFDFTSWVPQGFLESTGLSDLGYEGVLTKFEDYPSLETSFALCWQQLDSRLTPSNHSYDNILARMSVLVTKNRPHIAPDPGYGDFDDVQAVTYAHLAVGLALLLEKAEGGQSEKFWELLDDALRIIKVRSRVGYSLDDDNEFSFHMEKSESLLDELINCKQFHRCFNERKYLQALNFLEYASKLASDTEDCGFGEDYYSQLEAPYAGYDLVVHVIPEQKAVDAFEFLYEENSRNTNWKLLASHCSAFQHIYEDLATDSVSVFGVAMFSWDFWPLAHMLASQRISRDELVDVLGQMRNKEAETRLRLYFFHSTWNNLPEKARAAIISADREYENTHGRRQGIFEDLWLATREILVEVLVKPYNAFCAAQKEQREIKSFTSLALALDDDKDLDDIVQALYYAPLFEEYLRQTFNEDDKAFIKGAEKAFIKLNRFRNDTVHANRPAYKRNNFERDIRETYAEFLGIGRDGILPCLMRLHTQYKPSSRR